MQMQNVISCITGLYYAIWQPFYLKRLVMFIALDQSDTSNNELTSCGVKGNVVQSSVAAFS